MCWTFLFYLILKIRLNCHISWPLNVIDPMIVELCHSILTLEGQGVSNVVFDALSAAKASVANIHSATFKNNICIIYIIVL